MVAFKRIRVRARAGHFVALRGVLSSDIRYIGRKYDATGDKSSLETEFPMREDGEDVQPLQYVRKALADGELDLLENA